MLTDTFNCTLFSETIGPTPSGGIDVQAAQLQMLEGAGILGLTFSAANGGNINVATTEQLTISGFNAIHPLLTSTINSSSASFGGSGEIAVRTPNLLLSEGGSVSSLAFAQGGSGDIFVDADDIHLTGRIAASDVPSVISASNFGPGIAGDIEIVTERLTIEEEALIAASSISAGSAGNIRITATERIDVSQPLDASTIASVINSAVLLPTPLEQSLFSIPETFVPTGNAGNINIATPILTGSGPLRISVQNTGLGTGGDVQITADSIDLRDGSQISALTNSGDGGNIDLQIADSLILRNGSGLSVKSGGTGNGGNLELDSRVIIALENSDIVADAELGRGGNINITSQHLLGTSFRAVATSESDITASSEFGINGTVEIDTPTVDPASGVIVLSTTVVDADQQIATGCANDAQGNHFIASGRGGLPQNPQGAIASNNLWQDVRPIPTGLSGTNTPSPVIETSSTTVSQNVGDESVFEASNWGLNHNGDVQLIAGNELPQKAVSCLDFVM